MLQTISSAQTFVMKWIYPPLWFVGFGTGTLMLWAGALDNASHHAALSEKLIYLVAWVVGTGASIWIGAPLKRVRRDETSLYVSNYLDEIQLPLSAIAEVTEIRWINIRPITLHLNTNTFFGNRITFIPKSQRFVFSRSHPIVDALRVAAGLRGA